jgi:hypothetical protein
MQPFDRFPLERQVITCLHVSLLLLVPVAAGAQEQKPTPLKEPKTKLEAFEATTGAVIIRGFETIGTLRGQLGTSATVESREFTDASSGKKEFGISITVTTSVSYERKDTSYIDYDEIDSLLKGIDYIGRIDKSVTSFEKFEADYRTKGDLVVSTFTETNKVQAAVQSGRIGSVSAFYTREQLFAFRDLIQRAKAKLDAAKQ